MTSSVYCISHVSSRGVATLISHTGRFVAYSPIDVIAAFPASKSHAAAPARSEARTAAASGFLAASAPCAFCQAGEVSPPDSPTYGNPSVFHPVQS